MKKGNIVHYVTRESMRRNKKRTLTAWIGIVFMVLLETAVFVGKDTAVAFLEETAQQKEGKWHVSMFDLTEEDFAKVEALPYVTETARSKTLGCTDFAVSGNPEKPYLNIKAYESKDFDWMNIELTRGHLPEEAGELVLSEAALQDGALVEIGDTIEAEYFDRTITGLQNETWFPFSHVRVSEGETVPVPENFPYYGENESFRENREFTGETQTFQIVGFIAPPAFEKSSAAGYTALTLYGGARAAAQATFNLALRVDTSADPVDYSVQLEKIADGREMAFNDYLLAFSANSSDRTINTMIQLFTIFFVILIMGVSVILIYNVFNLSFQERSRYLGMLSSVGATSRQKRSSVYYEAFSLLLPALPVGILLGVGTVLAGMTLLKPYLLHFMSWGSYVEEIPVRLTISCEALGLIAVVSVATVLISCLIPARKVSKIGAVDSIRGNTRRRQREYRLQEGRIRRLGAEGMLAANAVLREGRKAGSIRLAAAAFLVILMVTAYGADVIGTVADKKLKDSGTMQVKLEGEDGVLLASTGSGEGLQEYEAAKKEILESGQVEQSCEWYMGSFAANVEESCLSQEYWDAYQDIFSEYYHRRLSKEEFDSLRYRGKQTLSVAAADDETLRQLADRTGTDLEKLKNGGAIVVKNGNLSTDNIGVYGMKPSKYRYFDIENMSSWEQGETIEAWVYSDEEDAEKLFTMEVAGFVSKEQLEPFASLDSQFLWIIISQDTCMRMCEQMGGGKDIALPGFEGELHIRFGENAEGIQEKLQMLDGGSNLFYMAGGYTGMTSSVADAVNGMIKVLLVCFVALASVICLMNLYNSISGRMGERRRELAVLTSVGMSEGQLRKMLLLECGYVMCQSILLGLVVSGGMIYLIRQVMSSLFGFLRLHLPVGLFAGAAAFTVAAVLGITLRAFRGVNRENLLDVIRQESI